jgi:hypothetical protein
MKKTGKRSTTEYKHGKKTERLSGEQSEKPQHTKEGRNEMTNQFIAIRCLSYNSLLCCQREHKYRFIFLPKAKKPQKLQPPSVPCLTPFSSPLSPFLVLSLLSFFLF